MFLHCVLALCSKFLILHRDEVLRSEQKQLHQFLLSIKPIKTLLKSCQLSLEPCWGDASHGGVHDGLSLLLPNFSSTPTFPLTSTLKVAHNLHLPSFDLSSASNFQVQNARRGTKEQLLEPIPDLGITRITLHPEKDHWKPCKASSLKMAKRLETT